MSTRTVSLPTESGVWSVSDLSTFASSPPPAHIAERLRVFAKDREGITGNACPPDSWGEWHVPAPVSLADGRWSTQKWHTVILPRTPVTRETWGEPRDLVPGNRTPDTVSRRTVREVAQDRVADVAIGLGRERAVRLRKRTAERRALARAIARGGHAPASVV